MLVPRRSHTVLFSLLSVVVAAAIAGCGGDDGPTALPSGPAPTSAAPTSSAAAPTATPTAAPAATTGTQRSPVLWLGKAATGPAAEVQLATRRYWAAVVRLAERPDPADPALTQLVVEPQRSVLVGVFTANARTGVSQRGPIRGTVTVDTVRDSTADVTTCLDQSLVKVYEKSGRARPGSGGGATPFQLELRKDGGSWKVARASSRSGTCPIPR